MDKILKDALLAARKKKRDLAELNAMLQKMRELKNPEPKLLKAIEDEIAKLGV